MCVSATIKLSLFRANFWLQLREWLASSIKEERVKEGNGFLLPLILLFCQRYPRRKKAADDVRVAWSKSAFYYIG